MAHHTSIVVDNHGVAEIMQRKPMATGEFYSLVFKELSQIFCLYFLLLFHIYLRIGILKPLWTPKANTEGCIARLSLLKVVLVLREGRQKGHRYEI